MMIKRLAPASVLLLGLAWAAHPAAQPQVGMQPEIDSLLVGLERSECEFYRNGTWHSGHEAQLHLRDKYDYLRARNQVETTEQFIDKAATQSSFSGTAYRVRCNHGAEVPSQQWMREQLAQIRRPL
jgi:hypothetical protein